MDLVLNNEIIDDALSFFQEKKLEIEYIEEDKMYKVFDFNTEALYTDEELVVQYLRETKRRYMGKMYW